MVKRARITAISIILVVFGLVIGAKAVACDFSTLKYAEDIRGAVLREDYQELARLAGGRFGPGSPHSDFLKGGKNAAEGAKPFKEFLAGNVTIISEEAFQNDRRAVRIFFVSSDKISNTSWPTSNSLINLIPYYDYFVCDVVVDDGIPYMPGDFCYSESDVLLLREDLD